jgi:transcriptional regulator with XRE-family HTH domain
VGGNPPTAAAQHIRDARERRGLSQEELARILGTSRRMVIRWEHGTTQPSLKYQRLLATVLGLPLSYLNGTTT